MLGVYHLVSEVRGIIPAEVAIGVFGFAPEIDRSCTVVARAGHGARALSAQLGACRLTVSDHGCFVAFGHGDGQYVITGSL